MKKKLFILAALAFMLLMPSVSAAELGALSFPYNMGSYGYDGITYEGGTVENAVVTVTDAELKYAAKNPDAGRDYSGYNLGVGVKVPAGYDKTEYPDATLTDSWGNSWMLSDDHVIEYEEGTSQQLVGLWTRINQNILDTHLGDDGLLRVYEFDWDGDGETDQTISIYLNPDSISYEENASIHEVTVIGSNKSQTFYVEDGKTFNQYLSTKEMNDLEDLMRAPEGKRFVGVFDEDGNKVNVDTLVIEDDMTLTVRFEVIQPTPEQKPSEDPKPSEDQKPSGNQTPSQNQKPGENQQPGQNQKPSEETTTQKPEEVPDTGDNSVIYAGLSIIFLIALVLTLSKYKAVENN